MTNTDRDLAAYAARAERLDDDRRAAVEDLKELFAEAKDKGRSKADIDGIRLHLKRRHWDAEKYARLRAAEAVADQLAASGTAPLFDAVASVVNSIKKMGADVSIHTAGMEPVHIKAGA